MVQWTTPFMIGVTNDGLNSDTVGQCFLSATNRLTYIIPQSTLIFKKLPTIFLSRHPSHALVKPAAGSYILINLAL
jgi:hypothetical protein